jgi:DNA-binding CsgD family transcriptional regulator
VAGVGEVETPTQRPCIEVLEGRSRGRVFELVRRQVVIGRSPGADLHLQDAGVSRRHVKLSVLEDGSVVAVDMRSTNGMVVNGDRLERVTLHDGDVLRLGPDALLRFTTCAPKTPISPRPIEREREGEPEPTDAIPIERTAENLEQVIVLRRPKLEDLPLSARQIEVGRLVAIGLTNAAIAERLGISHRTVTSHLDHIYSRLGIGSRAALARWIVERGLLEPE